MRKVAFLSLLLLLVSCSSPSSKVPAPATLISYEAFSQLRQEVAEGLKPPGFTRSVRSPDQEFYSFDPDMAWGKRRTTIVAGDDSKPSQFRCTFLTEQNDIAVVVQFMYTEAVGGKDIIGYMRLPSEEAEVDGKLITVTAPLDSIELFAYHNLVVMVRSFHVPLLQEASPAQGERLIAAHKQISRAVRAFLENAAALAGND